MVLYRFRRLIEKYTVDCEKVTVSGGKWSAGSWEEGSKSTEQYRCAIIPITEKRINESGGDYKAGDCDIFTLNPLDTETDTYIVHKGKKYKVMQFTDYSDYADFYGYVGRRVSKFDTDTGRTENTDRRA